MDNPRQTLLHLTSRGEDVRTLETGGVGKFTNMSQQPINDVNKFGLLHYSIPKTLDLMDHTSRSFSMLIEFNDGVNIQIPVTLPLLDYYRMYVNTMADTELAFCEVLQTSINWAIQKYWTANKNTFMQPAPLTHRGTRVCNRLGCIVQPTPDGKLQFIFGYRGTRETELDASGDFYTYRPCGKGGDTQYPVKLNSGAPVPTVAEARIDYRFFPGIESQNTPMYNFIDTSGTPITWMPAETDVMADAHGAMIVKVEFHHISKRLQLMLGSADSAIGDSKTLKEEVTNAAGDIHASNQDALYREMGRICLVNYKMAGTAPNNADLHRSGLIELTMDLEPNLFAPSFMFLALTTQGTKSKILGHASERAGWAIPTSANQFTSKYDNFPGFSGGGAYTYSAYEVRQVPSLLNLSPQMRQAAVDDADADEVFKDLICNRFDQLPWEPNEDAWSSADNTIHIKEINNFSLVRNTDMNAGHRTGSRMIFFGDLQNMEAQARKAPRSAKQFGLSGESMTQAPTFTVSMIDPNWLYTDVPNSTVQTLDVQVMWGDTAENVSDDSPYPVQFTLIASQ